MSRYQYVQLLTSLPALGPLFAPMPVPLSPIRLDKRLTLLTPEHQQQWALIEALLRWKKLSEYETDGQFFTLVDQHLPQLMPGDLLQLVQWRLDLRSLVAAVRMQAQGKSVASWRSWAKNSLYYHIMGYWAEKDFGLAQRFVWLPEFARLYQTQDALAAEKLLLQVSWQALDTGADLDAYDFTAVLRYLLKWQLRQRWLAYQGELARRRLSELVEQGMSLTLDVEQMALADF